MKTKIAVIILGAIGLAGCAGTNGGTVYAPAMASDAPGKTVTKYVPVAMPGQLMPIDSQAMDKQTRTLKGLAAIRDANKKAVKIPNSDEYVNAVMTYNYMPGALYQIYCAPLHVTDVEFAPGEKINSVAAGDTLRWQVSKTYSGSATAPAYHLVIKPVENDLKTDMVVMTDQRTYHIKLQSTSGTYMASVKWRYPDGDGLVTTFSPQSEGDGHALGNGGPLNINQLDFDYRVKLKKGSVPDWYPRMVFNDGVRTYIQMPHGMQEAPALFVGHGKDAGQIVNYRVRGDYYIVDTLFHEAQLRSGQRDQTVVQVTWGA